MYLAIVLLTSIHQSNQSNETSIMPISSADRSQRRTINPLSVKISTCILNLYPLEVVSRYRDPQLQVGGNNSYLSNFGQQIADIDVETYIILKKRIKTIIVVLTA